MWQVIAESGDVIATALLEPEVTDQGAICDGTLYSGRFAVRNTTVGSLDFEGLFTWAEIAALRTSTDPMAQMFVRSLDDPRRTTVDLASKRVADALDYLVSVGLLEVARKARILSGQQPE